MYWVVAQVKKLPYIYMLNLQPRQVICWIFNQDNVSKISSVTVLDAAKLVIHEWWQTKVMTIKEMPNLGISNLHHKMIVAQHDSIWQAVNKSWWHTGRLYDIRIPLALAECIPYYLYNNCLTVDDEKGCDVLWGSPYGLIMFNFS